MEYKPRYPQPFTVAEATQMDVLVLTEGLGAPVFKAVRYCLNRVYRDVPYSTLLGTPQEDTVRAP